MQKKNDLLTQISSYYSQKILEHGETPKGVDWNGEVSQNQRFEQLAKIINTSDNFSLADVGCGYGAMLDFLHTQYSNFSYLGLDISEEMIKAARRLHGSLSSASFITASKPDSPKDYNVASGIFNVRLRHTDSQWYHYIERTLDILDNHSRVGFSFNCLTVYSDEEKKREQLYYADPCRLFDFCKKKYSSNVALLHDYGLYEFTILVRK